MSDEVSKLRNALQAQREEGRRYRSRAQSAEAQLRDLLPRIEALETQSQPVSTAAVVDALAGIRRDLQAQLAGLQAEIDDLHQQLQEVMRRP